MTEARIWNLRTWLTRMAREYGGIPEEYGQDARAPWGANRLLRRDSWLTPNTMKPNTIHCMALLVVATISVGAQTTISNTNRSAYSANGGWIDWNLAPVTSANGVQVSDTFLAGYAYAANFGWIHFGDGAPANGYSYANTKATDCGVNVSPSGALTGYAYGANIGWIRFEQTRGQPTLNWITGQLAGYAYSANVGWIALDTKLSDLATTTLSRPDSDGDGIPDPWERLNFSNLTAANATSDNDGDSSIDLAEYQAGTNPDDAGSILRVTEHSYNADFTSATLTWTMVPTRNYRIEYDDDLLGTWTNSTLGTFTPTPAATATRKVAAAAAARRFLRVVAVQPLP